MQIDIKGAIITNNDKWIYDWMDMESTCPKDVINKISEAKGEDIEVIINSGGGDVYAGSEIYTALKDYKGNVVGKIVGIAASAASFAGMGCKTLKMSPTAQIMIHKAIVRANGNSDDFEHLIDTLNSHDEGICNAYVLKTGKTKKEIMSLMENETYFSAQQALKLGLVDEIMFDEGLKLSASIGDSILPQKLVEKLRNHLKQNPTASDKDAFLMSDEKIIEDENREENPQPVSDKNLQEQHKIFNKLKLKLLEV